MERFLNPYKPGAGHRPPYLAGREAELTEFTRLLKQTVILDNAVLTGLRGVGKTVLLEEFKFRALDEGWKWVGTDLSEAASVDEKAVAIRLLADLSVLTSGVYLPGPRKKSIGFSATVNRERVFLNYEFLTKKFESTPGLVSDKLKATLEFVWEVLKTLHPAPRGVIFAYDEAQVMSNQGKKEQYPLSVILDVFQSIQKKGVPFMLILAGLPTLFPKLVDARTFAERMFRVIFLGRLSETETSNAIVKPLDNLASPIKFNAASVKLIVKEIGCYPYFIQFLCREAFDSFQQGLAAQDHPTIPIKEIIHKLDEDFFAGRWARVTDRQRDLLLIIAEVEMSRGEFSVQEVVDRSKTTEKPFGNSQVNQMLGSLTDAGLIYKNRHGKYSFAVPLLGAFIKRHILGK